MCAEDPLKRAASAANIDLQRNGFVPSLSEVRLIHEVSDAIYTQISVLRLKLSACMIYAIRASRSLTFTNLSRRPSGAFRLNYFNSADATLTGQDAILTSEDAAPIPRNDRCLRRLLSGFQVQPRQNLLD